MESRPSSHILMVTCLSLLIPLAAWATSSTKLIYSFAGNGDGEYTDTELVMDGAGTLYGTSVLGGTFGSGTVFQISSAGVHTVLYSFTGGSDGGQPYKGVTLDAHGNLYGTAVTGGSGSCEGGCGVVYKLTKSGSRWTQSVIHKFTGGTDGSGPGSPVAFDSKGNFYGTTPTGGAHGLGVVYQLKPNPTGWSFQVIHAFTGGIDGNGGSAGHLLVDTAGNLFGVCTVGGANGFGNVYEISRSGSAWVFNTLYSFKDQPDGASPYGAVVFDKSGNLFGTTYYAGANDKGTVYKLTHNPNGTWTEGVLYSFKGGTDGASPISSLVPDSGGNFYGTTSEGGASACGCGVIFKLAKGTSGKWTESVVYRFPGTPSPGFAYNGMVSGTAANFYGATVHGGSDNDGALYELIP
jgi:uncharacterized repeat protein (TIGR03803 family)